MDLRERVAKAKGTSFEIAKRFDVSASWVRKLWRLLETTGSLLPGERGHRPRKVDAEGEGLIREWIASQPDMTIPEVMARYLVERGISVSEPAMRRTLKRMGLSRKKRLSSRQSAKANARLRRATPTLNGVSRGSIGG